MQIPPVKNPRAIEFTCVDHALDNQHEVDIVDFNGNVIQTMLVGDPPELNGVVEVTVNVQPVALGQYRFVLRAVKDNLKSSNSSPSDIWERVVGPPSNIKVK